MYRKSRENYELCGFFYLLIIVSFFLFIWLIFGFRFKNTVKNKTVYIYIYSIIALN